MSNEQLFASLAAAQADLSNVGFDKENGGFRGAKYASLAKIRDVVTPVLVRHGLGVMQFPVTQVLDGKPYGGCQTIVYHKSGESITNTLLLPIEKMTPQGGGGAITYARRYSLLGCLGIVGDNDDDAHEASRPTATTRPVAEKSTEKQSPGLRAAEAVRKWSGVGDSDAIGLTKKIVAQLNIKVVGGKMTDAQADEIVAFVEANKDKDFTKVVK